MYHSGEWVTSSPTRKSWKHRGRRFVLWYDWMTVWYVSLDRLVLWTIIAHILDILSTWVLLGVASDRIGEMNPIFNAVWKESGLVLAVLVVASWKLFPVFLLGMMSVGAEHKLYWEDTHAWRGKRMMIEPIRWGWVYICVVIALAVVNNVYVAWRIWGF